MEGGGGVSHPSIYAPTMRDSGNQKSPAQWVEGVGVGYLAAVQARAFAWVLQHSERPPWPAGRLPAAPATWSADDKSLSAKPPHHERLGPSNMQF